MSPTTVAPEEYQQAAVVFADARAAGQAAVTTLTSALDGSAGMAGSDEAGMSWGRSYDSGAAGMLAGASLVVSAAGHFGAIVSACAHNHDVANSCANIHAPTPVTDYHPDVGPFHAAPLASSVSEGSGGTPPVWSIVEKYVGRAWPDGHQDRLRAAAAAWRTAAASLEAAGFRMNTAIGFLENQQAPEIDSLIATGHALDSHLHDCGEGCRRIAATCDEYAGHLDDAHHRILEELAELGVQTAAIEAGGMALGLFTAGAGEVGAQLVEATRLTAAGARIARIIDALSAEAAVVAGQVSSAAIRINGAVSKAADILRVPIRLFTGDTAATESAAAVDAAAASGGWAKDGLVLDHAANAKVDSFLARASAAEPKITGDMQEINADVPGSQLTGLEYRLKSADSLKRKVATDMLRNRKMRVSDVLSNAKDSVRYTMEIPGRGYSAGVNHAVGELEARGYENITWKSAWSSTSYKGINSTWRDPGTGQTFEMQFHTPESFAAKMETHPFYEQMRLPGTSADVLVQAKVRNAEIFGRVPTPPNAADIAPPVPRNGAP